MPENSIIEWLKENSHWSHWVGLIIAAAGLIAGFLLAEKPEGEITLKFNTVKIAQAGVPGIKILDDSNNLITSNVFGTEVVIWNTGDLTLGVKSDRIRNPIKITFYGDAHLIDSVIQDTRNVDRNSVSIERAENNVTVNWQQFDPGDAIKLFVIYAGKDQSKVGYDGRFVSTKITDISEFREEYPGVSGVSALWDVFKYDFQHERWGFISFLVAFVLQVSFVIVAMVFVRSARTSRPRWPFLLLALSIVLMVFSSLSQFFSRGTPF